MGYLEIINILCDVTTKLSDLVDKMSVELAQADIAESVKEEMQQKKKECDDLLDLAEHKMRRIHDE